MYFDYFPQINDPSNNVLRIEQGLFFEASRIPQGNFSGMLMAFAYILGKSPRVFCISRKVVSTSVDMVLILPGKSPHVFWGIFHIPRKPFIKSLLSKQGTCLRV